MRVVHTILAAIVAAGLTFAAAVGVRAEPLKLHQGWVVAGADAPLLMFDNPGGIAKHQGASYALDAIHFSGTPPMITALGAGEIELAALAYSSFALAVQNAGMSNLRIVADVFQDGVPGYYTNEYMVLKDGPVKTVEDLKGKVAAANVAGSAVDMALRAMLKKHGLEDKKNITIVEVGFPNMRATLADHKVDIISSVRPFSADPALLQIARPLFTQKEAIGQSQMIILVASDSFLQKNRKAVVDYLEDSLRALAWWTDPANHDKVVNIIATFAKQPPANYASWFFTKGGDFYHDPKGLPNLDALQSNVDLQQELGFLKAKLDVKKYADLSLVQEAAGRIK
ncbi:MAG TPA: ABC transporter substrate-binding protein [Alphaproteobacteria bacterium]